MANRHAHKRLRAEIRARMASSGESYQRARAQILSPPCHASRVRTDLLPVTYFGIPATIATFEMEGLAFLLLFPSSRLWPHAYPHPVATMMRAWMRPRGVLQ